MSSWIKIKDEPLPIEEFILVKDSKGKIEAIHCFGGYWRNWYTTKIYPKEKLKKVVEWLNPKNIE